MQIFFLQKYQFIFRAVLLCGVLTGLLFSCGEGIRLFPFPPSEITRNPNFKWRSEEKIGYQENVHRFETKQEKQSKFQRDNPHQGTDVYQALNDSPFIAAGALFKPNLSVEFQTAKSVKIVESGSSRAPPVSESL